VEAGITSLSRHTTVLGHPSFSFATCSSNLFFLQLSSTQASPHRVFCSCTLYTLQNQYKEDIHSKEWLLLALIANSLCRCKERGFEDRTSLPTKFILICYGRKWVTANIAILVDGLRILYRSPRDYPRGRRFAPKLRKPLSSTQAHLS